MRCLIFGADGFLGANLCQMLRAAGHEVTGTALNRKGQTSLDALGVDIRVEYGDVTDYAFCERVVNATEAEWIFHLAAVSIVRIADANPARAIRTNVLGTLNVCEAVKGRRLLVASSDKAYGYQGTVYREDLPLMPTGAYEISKACADHVARLYGAIVVRCANLFGPGDLNWSRLVPGSCRRALAGESPLIHAGAWGYRREWLDVGSAAGAYILLAEQGQAAEAYNVGSGYTATAGQIAKHLAMLAEGPLPIEDRAHRGYEIPAQWLNSNKIRLLGWRPMVETEDALVATLRWYREYLKPFCVETTAWGDTKRKFIRSGAPANV